MSPVVKQLTSSGKYEVTVCVTGQHRGLLDQVLSLFSIVPDIDLDIMRSNQSLESVTEAVLQGVSGVIRERKPDLILVHGDTTSAFAAALAGFYNKVPVGHVEAGLRTGNINAPWPEEMNRRFVGQLASLHFAPTLNARENLLKEQVSPERVWVTGNTVIDALLSIVDKISKEPSVLSELFVAMPWLVNTSRNLVLVTGHRRENFGNGIQAVCRALKRIAAEQNADIVYPVHPNPNVMKPVHELLDGVPNIHLVPPMDYLPFVMLMSRAHIIITDSGGVQEEAPSLGKPVLVMRDTTERPEAVTAGTVRLVGVDEHKIFEETSRLLTDPSYYATMSMAHNPYGDGHASGRIMRVIEGDLGQYEFS
ncbi:UDP-N-acetylglucosamine 2-epimerase (non-hydrolyzing) (plasmid) [Rhizobium sp. SSM4.3]|uniref:UDP-N-acetylglucosamine 2-epimerase (non-hydrolyzing) n=2 Tax=Peteryoungia algae TaxID=2919917 RepID=A0ABT0CZU0_9HYPH|nr:UDP-N-acetylglucosamine 2-epimerase (non-hydrolyzing) [Rhizobium sp. SSM4.3]MCJ8238688.1 UDP-N-acetylglucosamine 2-epimerase (non-hydrolyzing) [Rhizobium sp. SSM4.3]